VGFDYLGGTWYLAYDDDYGTGGVSRAMAGTTWMPRIPSWPGTTTQPAAAHGVAVSRLANRQVVATTDQGTWSWSLP
jgi:hypothetical protein